MPITKNVTREQFEALEKANEIIKEVKLVMPYGSGNQLASEPGAWVRTRWAYEYALPLWKTRRKGLGGIITEAGNCDQMGALAYMYARNIFPANYNVRFCSITGHAFCCVGKSGWELQKYIVIDPWPIQSKALLVEDHFVHDRDLKVLREKSAKPGEIDTSKYTKFVEHETKKIAERWNKLTANEKYKIEPKYNQQHAYRVDDSNNPIEVTYQVGRSTGLMGRLKSILWGS
ncbi:MAG TPA: hypothetical protein VGZ01_12285 [Trinickia sp.]|jgi:hypothetical protein|nr:hypothetical protein [Trinickia sp.]